MGCFISDRTFPNGASVTSSLARVGVFSRNEEEATLFAFASGTILPMKLCENSILSISSFLSFPFSLYFIRPLPSTCCFSALFCFCACSKYIRVLLIALITRYCLPFFPNTSVSQFLRLPFSRVNLLLSLKPKWFIQLAIVAIRINLFTWINGKAG